MRRPYMPPPFKDLPMSDATDIKTPDSAAGTRKTALTDAVREHFSGDAPFAEKAKSFARARPWTSAAFLGVAAIGLLQTLRGSRR